MTVPHLITAVGIGLGSSATLVPAPTATPHSVRPDLALVTIELGVRDGALVLVTEGGGPVSQELWLLALQIPEGQYEADYGCNVVWSDMEINATPVDTTDWDEIWPGAAWHLDTTQAASTPRPYSGCAALDATRFGTDPVATFGAAGWNIGYGPMTPRVAQFCDVRGHNADSTVVAYIWMDGGRPFPIGPALVEGIDEAGELTGDKVPGAATASAAPNGFYSLYTAHSPCYIAVGL